MVLKGVLPEDRERTGWNGKNNRGCRVGRAPAISETRGVTGARSSDGAPVSTGVSEEPARRAGFDDIAGLTRDA